VVLLLHGVPLHREVAKRAHALLVLQMLVLLQMLLRAERCKKVHLRHRPGWTAAAIPTQASLLVSGWAQVGHESCAASKTQRLPAIEDPQQPPERHK